MTNRKNQGNQKGYDRAQESRDSQSTVEADMLFGHEPTDGLSDLMANDPAAADGRWELPQSVGNEIPTEQPQSSTQTGSMSGSVTEVEAPQGAMAESDDVDPSDKITTVVRRPQRSERQPEPKKKGFFARLFGRS